MSSKYALVALLFALCVGAAFGSDALAQSRSRNNNNNSQDDFYRQQQLQQQEQDRKERELQRTRDAAVKNIQDTIDNNERLNKSIEETNRKVKEILENDK